MSTALKLQAGRDPIAGSARTISIETIEQDFHRKVSQKIRLSGCKRVCGLSQSVHRLFR